MVLGLRAMNALADESAACLAEALGQSGSLHLPGARERHRRLLGRAIDAAKVVLESLDADTVDAELSAGARRTLVRAYAARAEDARHGANQLSLSAQRAPTRDDCDDGWRKVEEIVATAEDAAREAERLAVELDEPGALEAARSATAAARAARRIVEQRNHAYTFHADPGFSFGEGWYLAAAGVLANVSVQIEPDKPQTHQVQRFIHDAGLDGRLTSYRSRPRANKHLPEIVARAFRADPAAAQRALRVAFLGAVPIPPAIAEWIDRAISSPRATPKVLLWIRRAAHHPTRNTTRAELEALIQRALDAHLVPILVGDARPSIEGLDDAVDMTLWWKEPLFQGVDMRRAQLQLFEHLRRAHALVGQVGVTTAGMDGPALMGLSTMYITDEPNPRLGRWVGAVPGYQEIVRDRSYLDRISATLRRWASGTPGGR